jgi:hypothetical protein
VDIKITKEEKFVSLICSLPDSWDNLFVTIERNSTKIVLKDMVASLMSE